MALPRRPLGNTGLQVSVLGFGCSPLGGVFGEVKLEQAIEAVHAGFKAGINFFDTSPFYGATKSESVLGQCLAGLPRDEIIVATKVGRYGDRQFDFSAERITASVDESLQRLGLDYIDLIQCHDMEFVTLDQIVTETLPALQKLKEAGKVRHIGITGLPLVIFRKVLDRVPPGMVDTVLSYCHLSLNDSSLLDLIPYLKQKNLGIINASPLAMGLLSEQGPPEWHPAPEPLKSACAAAGGVCRDAGASISKLALMYSLHHADVATTLVGMSSREMVEQNVATAMEAAAHGFALPEGGVMAQVMALLQPVHNVTWASGLAENN
eukprot:jgi/Mesvir1/26590/Mv17777-RA.1